MQTKTKRPRRTPEQAQHFDRYSIQNAARAEATLQESGACPGGCNAYEDIFTLPRWNALGYKVKKGQHGARLAVIATSEVEEDGTIVVKQRLSTSYVFCRHQTEKMDSPSIAQLGGTR